LLIFIFWLMFSVMIWSKVITLILLYQPVDKLIIFSLWSIHSQISFKNCINIKYETLQKEEKKLSSIFY